MEFSIEKALTCIVLRPSCVCAQLDCILILCREFIPIYFFVLILLPVYYCAQELFSCHHRRDAKHLESSVIVLYNLQFTASDNPFGICKLFFPCNDPRTTTSDKPLFAMSCYKFSVTFKKHWIFHWKGTNMHRVLRPMFWKASPKAFV
jgi:hypothetical protein